MTVHTAGVVLAGSLVAALATTTAFAQNEPPARGVEVMTLTADVRMATNGNGSPTGELPGPLGRSHFDSDGSLAWNYRVMTRPVRLQVGASTGARYVEAGHEVMVMGHTAGANLGFNVGRRTAINAGTSVSYLPSYSLVPAPLISPAVDVAATEVPPGLLPESALDYAIADRPQYATAASVAVRRSLSSRTTVTVESSAGLSSFVDGRDPSLGQWSARGRLSQKLTKYTSLRAGYGRREGTTSREFATTGEERTPTVIDDIDLGVDYARSLAISRNATVSFSTGSAAVETDDRRRFTLTGGAHLNYKLGDHGNASVSYNRGVDLVAGFDEPVFTDGVSLLGSQQVGRRLTFSGSAAVAIGSVGAQDLDNRYESLTGGAQASYRLTRRTNVYVQYSAYRHRLGSDVNTLPGVTQEQFRHTVRGGITTSLPLLRDMHPRTGGK